MALQTRVTCAESLEAIGPGAVRIEPLVALQAAIQPWAILAEPSADIEPWMAHIEPLVALHAAQPWGTLAKHPIRVVERRPMWACKRPYGLSNSCETSDMCCRA